MDLVKRNRQQSDKEEQNPQRAKMNAITMEKDDVDEEMVDNHYTRPHWARATTEAPVKIGEKKETVVVWFLTHVMKISTITI